MLKHISIKSERDRDREPELGISHHCWGPWVVMGPGVGVRRLHRLLELNKDDLISQSGVHGPAVSAYPGRGGGGGLIEMQNLNSDPTSPSPPPNLCLNKS